MTTELCETDVSGECIGHLKVKELEPGLRAELVCEVLAGLALTAFFFGLVFAIKLCLEIGLQFLTYEVVQQVGVNRPF